MSWRDRTTGLIVTALVVSSISEGGCSRNPPPAPSASGTVRGDRSQNLGKLYFDPQGADFTLWVNRFTNEVYRNWMVPQKALRGFRGYVEFEFTIDRNGSMSALRMLKSSEAPPLDRAAEGALTGSRLLPLPDDYKPPSAAMKVTFFYDDVP
jgi:TonB family protein